jgi:hypothetical protein
MEADPRQLAEQAAEAIVEAAVTSWWVRIGGLVAEVLGRGDGQQEVLDDLRSTRQALIRAAAADARASADRRAWAVCDWAGRIDQLLADGRVTPGEVGQLTVDVRARLQQYRDQGSPVQPGSAPDPPGEASPAPGPVSKPAPWHDPPGSAGDGGGSDWDEGYVSRGYAPEAGGPPGTSFGDDDDDL